MALAFGNGQDSKVVHFKRSIREVLLLGSISSSKILQGYYLAWRKQMLKRKRSLPLFLLMLAGMTTSEGAWKNLELNSVWNSVTSFSRALLVLVSPACRNVSPPRPSAATLAVTVQLASVPVSFRRWSSRSDMRCWAAIALKSERKNKTCQNTLNIVK